MAHTIAVLNGSSRTAKSLVPLALEAGTNVRAIVRSASRAKYAVNSKVPNAGHLEVLEVPDLGDVGRIEDAIRGVDAVFITLGQARDVPTTLVQDGVHTVVAAIRSTHQHELQQQRADGAAALPLHMPRIVLLSSAHTSPLSPIQNPSRGKPTLVERVIAGHFLRHTYADLAQAAEYLAKQSAWGLEWMVFHPAAIVDVVEPAVSASGPDKSPTTTGWTLSTTELPGSAIITYARLAAAMLAAERNWAAYGNAHVSPVPGEPRVRASFADFGSMRGIVAGWARSNVLVPGLKYAVVFGCGIALGKGLQYA